MHKMAHLRPMVVPGRLFVIQIGYADIKYILTYIVQLRWNGVKIVKKGRKIERKERWKGKKEKERK